MTTDVIETQGKSMSLAPKNIEEALKFADMLSKSNMVPKEFSGNPGNILVAIQWGMELGLQPMQAMQNIAVINGRPSLWGDSVIALVKASPVCEYVIEEVSDTEAVCKVKRRGEPEQVRRFTTSDAKAAGLLGKSGPWTQYPKRMMQMRARSWALRDVFPDVLRGMPVAEELMDTQIERDITPAAPVLKDEPAYYTDEEFQANAPAWKKVVDNGKEPARFITFVESKGKKFTEEMKEIIHGWAKREVHDPATVDASVEDDFVRDIEAAERIENA